MDQTLPHIRLNAFLAQSGISSRRKADDLIASGNVRVNGKRAILGQKVSTTDSVEVQMKGGWKQIKTEKNIVHYLVYKPRGYVSSAAKQRQGEKIVTSLVPRTPRVFPVGRLDKESEGLILLTNDGELAQKLTHPSSKVTKTYEVHAVFPSGYTERILEQKLVRLRKGVFLGEGSLDSAQDKRRTAPCTIEIIRFDDSQNVTLRFILSEGRNRQIRKMLGTILGEVKKLVRTQIGNLDISIFPQPYTTGVKQILQLNARQVEMLSK